MANADDRLCFICGAQRELCSCERVRARHCLACHLLKHGDTPRAPAADTGLDSEPVAGKVDQCRDCSGAAEWYTAEGTGFCNGCGERKPANRTGLEVGW